MEEDLKNEPGVTEENYASFLNEAISKKDAEIRAKDIAHAETVRKLTEQIINRTPSGEQAESGEVVYTQKEIDDIRAYLFDPDKEKTNLDYVTKSLQLREAILQKEGRDIFVGRGSNFEPTQNDFYRAEQTAQVYKECIEYAQGDPSLFTSELMRRMKNDRR